MKTQTGSSTRPLHAATFLGAAVLQVVAGAQVWGQFPTAGGAPFAGLAAAALDSSAGASPTVESAAPAESPTAVLGETPIGTAFSYQGFLNQDGVPLSASADFQFTLWDAQENGGQIGPLVEPNNVAVEGGLFTVTLDFGG